MNIHLVAFGIAKDILNTKQCILSVEDQATIARLKQILFDRYPEFLKLKSLSFAVGDNYQPDNYQLKENDEVVILPPVSGG